MGNSMMPDQILTDVRAILVEIIGPEYALGLDIGMTTSIAADLELESIEFVKLATKLGERYGEHVDFVAFLADKTLNEIIDLRVGDVVNHIADCLQFASAVDG
jgi:acyl carrier protein